MKKLIWKSGLFLVCMGLVTCLIIYLSTTKMFEPTITKLTRSEAYKEQLNASNEVITYINLARENPNSTKLIVGDSVCNSLFGELQEFNDDFTILGCNKGITMAGQYILVKEYLDSHDNVSDVYLMAITNSLITGFDTDFGYQYAVIPFVRTNTISYLDDRTIEEMKHLYLAPFLNEKVIDCVEASPLIKKLYLNFEKDFKPTKLTLSFPEVTVLYIKKMYELCEERNITMHFLSPPYADSKERRAVELVLEQEYKNSELYSLFPSYYDTFLYYDKELFPDGIHPSIDRKEKDVMVRDMMEVYGVDLGLRFE